MKKNLFLPILLLPFIFLTGCSNEDELDLIQKQNPTEDIRICTIIYPDNDGCISDKNSTETRGVLLHSYKWPDPSNITVKFLNGSPTLQNKVAKYMMMWTFYSGVRFHFVPATQNADIRIGFIWNGNTGSWSGLGTSSRGGDQNQPSVNFGWLYDDTDETEVMRMVLHEIGHALSLDHEHQTPAEGIIWNIPAVYNHYQKEHGWSEEQTYYNVLEKLNASTTNYTSFDKYSIMGYAFPASLTLNGVEVGWNTTLSAVDKDFIGKMYPSPTRPLHRYCIKDQHFYTSNFDELQYAYWEGVIGKVYTDQAPNTTPIYRYHNKYNNDRMSTIDYNELREGYNGWALEGITGYAYSYQAPGTIPVYRYSNPVIPNHFFTTNYNELGHGKGNYYLDGIAFYILPY